MFNQGDVIELEGFEEKYVVLKYINDMGKIFLVLADSNESTIIKYCALEGSKIKVIQDPKIIEYITDKIK